LRGKDTVCVVMIGSLRGDGVASCRISGGWEKYER
jgi:hypothetical protein